MFRCPIGILRTYPILDPFGSFYIGCNQIVVGGHRAYTRNIRSRQGAMASIMAGKSVVCIQIVSPAKSISISVYHKPTIGNRSILKIFIKDGIRGVMQRATYGRRFYAFIVNGCNAVLHLQGIVSQRVSAVHILQYGDIFYLCQ